MKILISTLFFFFYATQTCLGQWVKTNGPQLNPVDCFALAGENLFAGVSRFRQPAHWEGGIFISTNNGVSWNGTSLDSANIHCLLVSDTNIYAGGYEGVFLSTNNGNNWTNVGLGFINALTVLGTNLFAGGGGGVFRSTNCGSSWIPTGLGLSEVNALAVSGVNLFAGTTPDGVFISTNNGTSWNAVNTGLTNTYVHCLAISGANIFAGTEDGVFLSTNYGATWTSASNGLTNGYILSLTVYDNYLFAGTQNGVYFSDNNGETWIHKGPPNVQIHAIKVLETQTDSFTFLAGTFGGIFISTDNGSEWSMVCLDLPTFFESNISALTVSDSNIIAVTSIFTSLLNGGSFGAMFLSSNNGDTWRPIYGGDFRWGVSSFAKFTDNDTEIFAGIDHGPPWGVLYSSDTGNSWMVTNSGLPEYPIISALTTNGTKVFAANDGIYMSTDKGENWTLVNNYFDPHILVSSGTNLFAGSGSVYISTDYGINWTDTGPSGVFVTALAVSGTNLFAGTDGNGIFLSTNNGTSWDSVNTGLTDTKIRCLVVSGNNVFAGTEEGVFLSTNNGTNWIEISSGLPNLNILALAVSTNYIFAGTSGSWSGGTLHFGQGVWRRPLSEVITSNDETTNPIPKDFILRQNYPNPFNPSTKIKYSIPQLSNVVIKVFDILGNELETLVHEEKPAGIYELTWNVGNLPSGVYFYQLRVTPGGGQAGDPSTGSGQVFVKTKKMILLK